MVEKKRVLALDDSPHDVEFLESTLADRRPDVELVVCRDGEELLARLDELDPDLVLLDLKFPGVGGHEVLAEIRRRRPRYVLPVVVLTSSAEPGDILRAYREGASSYVLKPVPFEEFAGSVTRIVEYWLDLNASIPPRGHVGDA